MTTHATAPDQRAGWFARFVSRQAAQPHGGFGWLLGWIWWFETAAVNDHALTLLAPARGERIVELGFGPGRAIGRLVAAGTTVVGVDVAPRMVRAAGRRNRRATRSGAVRLCVGDGTRLPVDDATIDAVLSVHTLYFWSDHAAVARELVRVLRPGGRLVLGIRDPYRPLPTRLDPDVYTTLSDDELNELLHAAGFATVDIIRDRHAAADAAWVVATTPADQRDQEVPS
jgi:SAM-dependent methyltransferase